MVLAALVPAIAVVAVSVVEHKPGPRRSEPDMVIVVFPPIVLIVGSIGLCLGGLNHEHIPDRAQITKDDRAYRS
jgi:hypothetical protein